MFIAIAGSKGKKELFPFEFAFSVIFLHRQNINNMQINNLSMKKNLIIASITASLLFGVSVTIKNDGKERSFLDCNVEALTEAEAVITCSAGIDGRCFAERWAWPFCKCVWTGRQIDFCDC